MHLKRWIDCVNLVRANACSDETASERITPVNTYKQSRPPFLVIMWTPSHVRYQQVSECLPMLLMDCPV